MKTAAAKGLAERKNDMSEEAAAKLLGISPMLVGKYEKGSIAIPENVAEKLQAAADAAMVTEIEVKKTVRKAGRMAKEAVDMAANELLEAVSGPNIIIQSPMGGYIQVEEIVKKVPADTADVYVRVDENKLYYVLKNGESGDVDIWD